MLSFRQKIGTRIIAISISTLVITVALALVVTLLLMKQYNDSVLMERAHIGTNILEDTVKQKLVLCEEAYWVEVQDPDFSRAVEEGDTSILQLSFTTNYGDDKGMFLMVKDPTNYNVIYKSSNCPLDLIDVGTVHGGLYSSNGVTVGLYSEPVGDYYVIVGYNFASTEWLNVVKNNTDCNVTIFNDNIRMVSTIPNVTGTPIATDIGTKVLASHQTYSGKATIGGAPYYVSYTPMYDYTNNVCGAYFAGSDASEVSAEFARVIAIAVGIAVAMVIITIIITATSVRKSVVMPINAVSEIANEMAEGKLGETQVNYQFQMSEIGLFADTLKKTRAQISSYISDISKILAAMGTGNFTVEPGLDYIGDFATIQHSFEEIESSLASIVHNMDVSADGVSSGSNQIANGAQLLAEGTTRQATAIEEINATISNITKQVSETAENASTANGYAATSLHAVENQSQQMQEMLQAMGDIKEQSSKISNIIKTIEDIAFQTNILALNASVEAARAGNAGKGFAVVADEVRNLAAKSAQAASDTNTLISATIKSIDSGVSLAKSTADSLSEVMEHTKSTSNIIQQINAAAIQQAEAVQQVSVGMSDVSGVVSQNSATAEETAASCEELASQSNILRQQVSKFVVN